MTFFTALQTESKVRMAILAKALAADNWQDSNGIDRIELDVSDFEPDPKIVALIKEFDCAEHRRLSVFRFKPYTCHAWHVDLLRNASINMLLSGWDCKTLFGTKTSGINLSDVTELKYEYDRYYLLNSKQQHTVINFARPRYLVSIGIPGQFTHDDVHEYIMRMEA